MCHAHPPAGHVVLSKFGLFPSNEQSAWLRVPYPNKGMTRAHYGSPRPRKIILLYQNLWPPCENAKSALRPYANLTKSMCFQQSVAIHPHQGIETPLLCLTTKVFYLLRELTKTVFPVTPPAIPPSSRMVVGTKADNSGISSKPKANQKLRKTTRFHESGKGHKNA